MRNPFRFGVVVRGTDFCDREREIAALLNDIRSGVHVTLVSPRRYGKTSLIVNLFERVDFATTIYVDLMGVTSLEAFLRVYTEAFFRRLQGRRKLETLVRKLLPKIEGVQLSLGAVGLSVNIAPTERNAEEVLGISERLETPVVVALDEFQEITNIKEVDLLSILRKKAQFFENTTLLFAGSRRHVVCDIFSNAEKPFYRFSKIVSLGVLDKIETVQFLKRKFAETLFEVPDEVCESIYEITEGHPYYVQYLAHHLWNTLFFESKNTCTKRELDDALNQILITERPMFETLWDSLTVNQRLVLKNIAIGKSPYGLKISAGSVKRTLEALENLDVIEREEKGYKLIDPLLRLWLSRMESSS